MYIHIYIYTQVCKTVHRYTVSVMVNGSVIIAHGYCIVYCLRCVHEQSSMSIVIVGQTSPPCPSVSLGSSVHPSIP